MNVNVRTKFNVGDEVIYTNVFRDSCRATINGVKVEISKSSLYQTHIVYTIDRYTDKGTKLIEIDVLEESLTECVGIKKGDTVKFKELKLLNNPINTCNFGSLGCLYDSFDCYKIARALSNATVLVEDVVYPISKDGFNIKVGEAYYSMECFEL